MLELLELWSTERQRVENQGEASKQIQIVIENHSPNSGRKSYSKHKEHRGNNLI